MEKKEIKILKVNVLFVQKVFLKEIASPPVEKEPTEGLWSLKN
jgi:hypothetical protein